MSKVIQLKLLPYDLVKQRIGAIEIRENIDRNALLDKIRMFAYAEKDRHIELLNPKGDMVEISFLGLQVGLQYLIKVTPRFGSTTTSNRNITVFLFEGSKQFQVSTDQNACISKENLQKVINQDFEEEIRITGLKKFSEIDKRWNSVDTVFNGDYYIINNPNAQYKVTFEFLNDKNYKNKKYYMKKAKRLCATYFKIKF